MLIKIDFESDTPLYIQLKRQLIQGIARGQLKQGESLPSVRQLAEDIGINMHTVNKAYNLLKQDGYVSIDRRKGAIVNRSIGEPGEDYMSELKEELSAIIAEAYTKGVKREEFKKICHDIFIEYEGE
mgnify:FL=1